MRVTDISPIDGPGVPFGAWRGLDHFGYAEDEFIVSGAADALDPDGKVLAAEAPYTTRALVRRPLGTATGTVLIEPFHNINERTALWNQLMPWIVEAGHTWIGVTAHTGTFSDHFHHRPGGLPLLQQSDPARYRRLHLATYDLEPPRRMQQGPAGFDPFEMNWRLTMANPQGPGIASDVSAAARKGLLPEVHVDRLIAVGASQTARFWRHALDSGRHSEAVDAYILGVGPAPSVQPPGVTFVHVITEAEVVGTLNPRWLRALDDSDSPTARGYEIAGTSHDIRSKPSQPGHAPVHNDRPCDALLRGIAAHLEHWLRLGVPMPPSVHIERDHDSFDGVARDEHGNALGGVRGPWLDVPAAQYFPRCSCGPTISEMAPFGEEKMRSMYGSRAAYEGAFEQCVDLQQDLGVLLPADAARCTPDEWPLSLS
jgi:hypothetical protein